MGVRALVVVDEGAGAQAEERLDGFEIAFFSGDGERGISIVVLAVGVEVTACHEILDCRRVAPAAGGVMEGGSAKVVGGVRVGAKCDEGFEGKNATASSRNHERGFSVEIGAIGVELQAKDEVTNDIGVSSVGCQVKGGLAVDIGDGRIGAALNE